MLSRTLRFALLGLAALAPAALLALACSGGSSGDAGASCPNIVTTCPSTTPSWKTDVQPLIATYCFQCHGDGGIEQAKLDYTTYAGVFMNRAEIITQVYECMMPPSDASPPPMAYPNADQRETIVSWVACGAPNN